MAREVFDFEWEFDLDNIGKSNPRAWEFADAMNRGIEKGMKQVAERTIKRIKESLVKYGLGDSYILNSIDVTILDQGISIKLSDENYLFVEYGTGVVGESGTKHPFLKSPHNVDWQYDTNNHGESGWWYPTVPVDPNPTTKQSPDGGWVAWTKGQRSRPFMYDGWLYASRAAVSTVNYYIAQEFKKLEAMQ